MSHACQIDAPHPAHDWTPIVADPEPKAEFTDTEDW